MYFSSKGFAKLYTTAFKDNAVLHHAACDQWLYEEEMRVYGYILSV